MADLEILRLVVHARHSTAHEKARHVGLVMCRLLLSDAEPSNSSKMERPAQHFLAEHKYTRILIEAYPVSAPEAPGRRRAAKFLPVIVSMT